MASQAPSWAAVGSANAASNQARVAAPNRPRTSAGGGALARAGTGPSCLGGTTCRAGGRGTGPTRRGGDGPGPATDLCLRGTEGTGPAPGEGVATPRGGIASVAPTSSAAVIRCMIDAVRSGAGQAAPGAPHPLAGQHVPP